MQTILCVCRRNNLDSLPTLPCSRCRALLHPECYGHLKESRDPILCVQCRILKIQPTLTLSNLLLPPFRIPPYPEILYLSFTVSSQWIKSLESGSLIAAMHIVGLERELPNIYSADSEIGIHINSTSLRITQENHDYVNVLPYLQKGVNSFSIGYPKKPSRIFVVVLGLYSRISGVADIIALLPVHILKSQPSSVGGDELHTTAEKINLQCPLTLKDLEFPGRSYHCRHISCLDLKAYLLNNMNRSSKWQCPLCREPAYWDDLYKDETVLQIVESIKKKYGSCEDVEIEIDLNGNWKDSLREVEQSESEEEKIESPEAKEEREARARQEEKLAEVCSTISSMLKNKNSKQIKTELQKLKTLESLNAMEIAFIVDKCCLIPRNSMRMCISNEISLEDQKGSLRSKLKDFSQRDSIFWAIIRVWERPIPELTRLASYISHTLSDGNLCHYQMLGVVALLGHIYHTYTLGSVLEKVIGLAVGIYAKECGFRPEQIAKAADVITKRFPELDLPSEETFNLYQSDREGYFTNLINFYSSFLSVFPAQTAGKVFAFLFTPPQEEIQEGKDFQFHQAMECLFLKKILDELCFSSAQCGEFLEIWDSRRHMLNFLHKIGRLHSYGFTYDLFSKSIVRSSSLERQPIVTSRLSRLLL